MSGRLLRRRGATVKLKRPAAEFGLGRGDDELGAVVGRLLIAPPEDE